MCDNDLTTFKLYIDSYIFYFMKGYGFEDQVLVKMFISSGRGFCYMPAITMGNLLSQKFLSLTTHMKYGMKVYLIIWAVIMALLRGFNKLALAHG